MLNLASAAFQLNSPEFDILAALLRNGKLALPELPVAVQREIEAGRAPGPNLATALHSQLSLEPLGFAYGKDVIVALSWLEKREIVHMHDNVVRILTRALGAHQLFQPMYPNFPEQVLAASDAELLTNAWLHYLGDWVGVRVLPRYAKVDRAVLKYLDNFRPTVLTLAEPNAVAAQVNRLVNGNASMSASNKTSFLEMLGYLAEHQPGHLAEILGKATVPQKETRALVGGWLLKLDVGSFATCNFERLFQTPTDVLRLAAAVSASDLKEVDLSLSQPPRFGNLSRPVRRLLLSLLDKMGADSVRAEMFQRREQWLRAGEALHPGEYHARFKRAYEHFAALRNKTAPASWMGSVEHAVVASDTSTAISLLSQRPGVFARRLHEVVRKAVGADKVAVVDAFEKVAHQVSTPVLLQLRQRIVAELAAVQARAFSPKGGAGRMWVPTSKAQRMDATDELARRCTELISKTLRERFAKLPAMGKVYLDPALEGYTVPFAQRTAQKALRTVGRGSRVDLGAEPIMRAFMWWNESGKDKDGNDYTIGRTDLDLSCAVLDASFNYLSHCSFTNLRGAGLTHSGDVTSAPNGACEFIDINFDELPSDAAYVALLAYAYTQQNFADMPEAFLGWMTRPDGQSGEVYEARTVRQKVDLAAAGQRVLLGYVDVARRQFVWADLVLPARCSGFNAIESSTDMTSLLARGIVNPIRPTLGALVADHAAARGSLVDNPADADIVFTVQLPGTVAPAKAGQVVVSAYDADTIVADYLQ